MYTYQKFYINVFIGSLFRYKNATVVSFIKSKHAYQKFCIHVFITFFVNFYARVLYGNIDQTLVNSLQGLLKCEKGGLDYQVITTEYKTGVHCIHM